ncbi:hypothetical protein EYR40_002126 [Pleurotus pulmonarius]|nr:hypothetical protein EYR36_011469 [Pleurotus pulmonarius]KAF4585289.1 hypothetical protein EYR40_002126 [Pleurotus pulmonarius]
MTDFYDYEQAGIMLEALMQERAAEGLGMYMLKSNIHSIPFNGARIVNDDEGFEATFAIQGIVHSTILPPFYHLSRSITENQARHLRQSISLTGYKLPAFGLAVDNILEIYAHYERIAPEKSTVKEPSFITTDDNIGPTIDFSNRFFTPSRHADTPLVDISVEVDPYSSMANADRLGFAHTEENEVRYAAAIKIGNKWRFHKIKPNDIRKGDIVEIQFNLTLISTGQNTFVMRPILREVARFDNSLSLTASTKRQAAKLIKTGQRQMHKRAKRRLAYDDDNELDIDGDVRRMKEVKLT